MQFICYALDVQLNVCKLNKSTTKFLLFMIKFINLSIKTIAIFGVLTMGLSGTISTQVLQAEMELSQKINTGTYLFKPQTKLNKVLELLKTDTDISITNIGSNIRVGQKDILFETTLDAGEIVSVDNHKAKQIRFISELGNIRKDSNNEFDFIKNVEAVVDKYSLVDLEKAKLNLQNNSPEILSITLNSKFEGTISELAKNEIVEKSTLMLSSKIKQQQQKIVEIEKMEISDQEKIDIIQKESFALMQDKSGKIFISSDV